MKPPRGQQLALYLIGAIILAQAPAVTAAPWIEAGDERTRHHLLVLADAGLIKLPLNTWPVMWKGIDRELQTIELAGMTQQEIWSYQYLKHELRRAQRSASAGQQISVNSSRPGLIDYGADSREKMEIRSHGSYTGTRFALKLQVSAVGDRIDDQGYRVDGSYLAGMIGNWAVGVGAIDRWWGPGWQSGLILSNNARPTPGLFVNRVDNRAFDLPILKWLGSWDLRFFVNQLESDRAIPDAKLFGMRMAFKPLKQLEIGFSRTAQWGGEDRPQGLSTFWNMVIGADNRGKYGITAENEPGNQLAGGDWRLSQHFGGVSVAFYGELIGEDENDHHPLKLIGMGGLETSFSAGSTHNRIMLEASNTTMEFDTPGGTPNGAYEHSVYHSGYRYRGRPLGASTDNDTELVVLKGYHDLSSGHQFSWTLGSGRINMDDTNRSAPGGSVYGADRIDLSYATAQYALPIGERSQVSLGAQYYDNPMQIHEESIESGVYLTYRLRL